jgi:hypothetical protein
VQAEQFAAFLQQCGVTGSLFERGAELLDALVQRSMGQRRDEQGPNQRQALEAPEHERLA